MARARNIKPGFFTNDLIAEMSPWARLTFIGLWTLADKAGRMLYRPKKIKMELFPGDNIDVEPLIDELITHGFVEVYEADGIAVLAVINFTKHQNPHPKEKESELPPKKPVESTIRGKSRQAVESNGPAAKSSEPTGLIPDIRIPDSGSLNADNPQSRDGADAPDRCKPPRKKSKGKTLSPEQIERFERWYSEWPRKVNRAKAEEKWAEIDPDDELTEVMVAKTQEWASSPEWTKDGGQYIPHPATWLHNKRWTDGSPSKPADDQSWEIINGGNSGPGPRGYTAAQLIAMSREENVS